MEPFEREIYRHYFQVGGFRPMPNETRTVSLDDLIDRYEAFFFDAFGTFYCQHRYVYPGAQTMYRKVRQSGKPMRLVTNAASQSVPHILENLQRMEIPFAENEIISSGTLFADFAQRNSVREAFYVGRPDGVYFLESVGVVPSENPAENTVIVSATDNDRERFERACEILRGRDAKLIVLNPDAWAPRIGTPREGVSGAYAHRLYLETHPQAFYFGKPFPGIFQKAISSLPKPMRAVMVGDTLATDIGGALNAGIDACLIIGRNEPASELAADEAFLGLRPTYYLGSV